MRQYIPRNPDPDLIREICEESGLSFAQIIETLDLPAEWVKRAFIQNPKYRFTHPNPERMRLIYRYAHAYAEFQEKWNDISDAVE